MTHTRGATSPLSSQKVGAAVKQQQALTLRAAGYSFTEIAQSLGYRGKQGAHNAVLRGLQKLPVDAIDDLRTLENERLDGLWKLLTEDLEKARTANKENHSLAIFDRLLRLSERRAALNGLNKPLSVRFSIDEPLVIEKVDYRASLAALAPPSDFEIIEGRLSDVQQEAYSEAAPTEG